MLQEKLVRKDYSRLNLNLILRLQKRSSLKPVLLFSPMQRIIAETL